MNALPHYRGCLITVLLVCALTGQVRAAEPECPPAPASELVPATAEAPGTIHWSGCRMTVAANGDTELTGDVAVSIDGKELHCDHLNYLAATQELKMAGTVRLEDAAVRIIGDAGDYSNTGAQLTHAQFELLQHPGRGEADAVSTVQPDVFELTNVSYTTCPKGVTDWQLRARSITLDTKTLRGVGHHTVVVFKDVPILYLPWISFPLSSARQSGFLYPTLGSSSRSGAIFSIPWYWNIAPNQDLTATPTVYTRRGVDLGAEYRLLERHGQGTLRINYSAECNQLANTNRSWQRLDAIDDIGDQWRARVNVQNVSDTHYFEDFGNGPLASSTVFLPRDLSLTRRDDVWQLGAQVLTFQTLDDQLDRRSDRPYWQLPRLTALGRWQSHFGPDQRSGKRTDRLPTRYSAPPAGGAGCNRGSATTTMRPGFYLRPHAAWNLTAYDLHDAPTADATPTRNLPILTLDSAVQLERSAGADDARRVTLEPRIKYVYIPVSRPVHTAGIRHRCARSQFCIAVSRQPLCRPRSHRRRQRSDHGRDHPHAAGQHRPAVPERHHRPDPSLYRVRASPYRTRRQRAPANDPT